MLRRFLFVAIGLSTLIGTGAAADAARLPASGGRIRVWVANDESGTMLAIDAATRQLGHPVKVNNPFSLAITPNARRILILGVRSVAQMHTSTSRLAKAIRTGRFPSYGVSAPDGKTFYVAVNNTVVPIDVAANKAGRPIVVAQKRHGPSGLALAPDGKTLYAVDVAAVRPINTSSKKAGKPIPTGSTSGPMVITPDGKTGYVAGFFGTVIPVDLVRKRAEKAIKVGGRFSQPLALVITPDGKTVYVSNFGNRTVVPISTDTNTAGTPIKVGDLPWRLAVTPTGRTVYVPCHHAIYAINTRTNRVAKVIKVRFIPLHIAITPDGKTAWVGGFTGGQGLNPFHGLVLPIRTSTNTPGKVIKVGKGTACVVIRPWRAGRVIGPSSCDG